jgi:hypothetical protein
MARLAQDHRPTGVASRDTTALPSLDVVTIKGFCQHSRHEGETGHADGSDLGYATSINSINYTNRS